MERYPIALLMTDLHIEDSSVEICKDIASQAIELATSLGIKTIINAGDVFTERKSQTFASLMAFISILNEMEKAGITMEVIPGNHDKLDESKEESYLDVFESHPAIFLIRDTDTCLQSPDLNMTISYIPYFTDEGYLSRLSKCSADVIANFGSKTNILITHIGVDGAVNNSGDKIASSIKRSSFVGFDKVFVGHYHDSSKVGDKIEYFGSCRQAWFDERSDKGFTVLFSDSTTEFYQSEYRMYIERNIELDGDYVKKIDSTVKKLIADYPEDMKRIHLIGNAVDIRSVDVSKIKLKGVAVRTTDISEVDTSSDESGEFRYVEFDEDSILDLFMEFIEEEGVKDEAVEYGAIVLGKAIERNKK